MKELETALSKIKDEFKKELAEINTVRELEDIKVKYLGKKGELKSVMGQMKTLSPEERPILGQLANKTRLEIENGLIEKSNVINENAKKQKLFEEEIDVTEPGREVTIAPKHPITQVIDEINEIFIGLGFTIAQGPEVEYDKYNFELLNIPAGHPARDTQDTFYISEHILLRTQTSPVQIRVMENAKPPIKVVCPGKVYRSDSIDATHSPIFYQIEGLVVDKDVTMGDLTGCLRLFAKRLFGEETEIRLRPHHFPFTEPSCEVDVTCWRCKGRGCKTCKNEGFIEVLGAGMVHPQVLKNCNIDPDIYSGFAFGIGVDRTAMARFGIDDIRNLYENDVRFLKQF